MVPDVVAPDIGAIYGGKPLIRFSTAIKVNMALQASPRPAGAAYICKCSNCPREMRVQ
jgi:hypothetical protein